MEEYKREYFLFSLCGLNCGLCPRYQSRGESKCPGCGGKDFHLKHPTCSVITCSKKHSNTEYCFQCPSYPCLKYKKESIKDSFISYQNVKIDFDKCSKKGIEEYKKELNKKINILEFLLNNYNNGRLKNFYCLAVNLLNLEDLEEIVGDINKLTKKESINNNEKIEMVVLLFKRKAVERNLVLKLRK
jgi:hypothetical protein